MVLFSSVAGAEIKRVTLKTKNPIQYNKVDIDIELVAQFSNPYFQEEVKLDMYIKTPSGKELVYLVILSWEKVRKPHYGKLDLLLKNQENMNTPSPFKREEESFLIQKKKNF